MASAFAGLLGVVVGAALAALFTTRRERWNLKCDLYLRLLEHLDVTRMILYSWLKTPSSNRERDFFAEGEQIWRAHARAKLILDPEMARAIDELETNWRSAGGLSDAPAAMQLKVQALQGAYDRVRAIARRDLHL
jgi:hypothetical protein